MRKTFAAFALLASLFVGLAARAAMPAEITAEYQLSHRGFGVIGRVTESFVRTGDTYSIKSQTRSEGALKVFFDDQISLESVGKIVAAGLRPASFSQQRASSTKHDTKATFDWDKGIMRSVHEGSVNEVPLPPETQDRISVMYQFMNVAMGSTVTMNMSNGRKIERYTYRFVGEERVTTPAGEFSTVHYERVTAPGESKAEFWLAKDRFNIPVRVVFDDPKGLRLEQVLASLNTR
jgi:hypothetical protein